MAAPAATDSDADADSDDDRAGGSTDAADATERARKRPKHGAPLIEVADTARMYKWQDPRPGPPRLPPPAASRASDIPDGVSEVVWNLYWDAQRKGVGGRSRMASTVQRLAAQQPAPSSGLTSDTVSEEVHKITRWRKSVAVARQIVVTGAAEAGERWVALKTTGLSDECTAFLLKREIDACMISDLDTVSLACVLWGMGCDSYEICWREAVRVRTHKQSLAPVVATSDTTERRAKDTNT